MVHANTRPAPSNAKSIDRVDSSVAYTDDNCTCICFRCNHLKNSGTAEEHRKIAEWMDEYERNPPAVFVEDSDVESKPEIFPAPALE